MILQLGHEFIYHNKEDDILMYDVIKNGIKKVVDGSLIVSWICNFSLVTKNHFKSLIHFKIFVIKREYTYDLQEYSISADKLFLLLTSSISKVNQIIQINYYLN